MVSVKRRRLYKGSTARLKAVDAGLEGVKTAIVNRPGNAKKRASNAHIREFDCCEQADGQIDTRKGRQLEQVLRGQNTYQQCTT